PPPLYPLSLHDALPISDQGVEKLEAALSEAGLLKSASMYDVENVALVHHANSALRAHKLFRKDKDYIVRDTPEGGEVVIIDEFSDRKSTRLNSSHVKTS